MALFVKEDKRQKPDAGLKASPPGVPGSAQASKEDAQAYLGQGSRVEGKLTFEGTVRIDGRIDGEINAKDLVVIGESAEVTAQIHTSTLVMQGRVRGDITASKRVELRAPGTLVGNITTPCLVIHEGVVFEGHCTMGGAADSRPERGDKRVALFPAEERNRSSEAAS